MSNPFAALDSSDSSDAEPAMQLEPSSLAHSDADTVAAAASRPVGHVGGSGMFDLRAALFDVEMGVGDNTLGGAGAASAPWLSTTRGTTSSAAGSAGGGMNTEALYDALMSDASKPVPTGDGWDFAGMTSIAGEVEKDSAAKRKAWEAAVLAAAASDNTEHLQVQAAKSRKANARAKQAAVTGKSSKHKGSTKREKRDLKASRRRRARAIY